MVAGDENAQPPNGICTHQRRTVTSLAKDELFRFVKFVNNEKDLEGCGPQTLGGVVTGKLNIVQRDREAWWHRMKTVVARSIATRRNDCQTAMKTVVIATKKAEAETGATETPELPLLENILKMREDKEGAYTFFADHLIECVAGKRRWKNQKREHLMTAVVSPTDEAFALLILENSIKRWIDMAKHGAESTEKPKYTRGKAAGGSRKYEGWTDEGKQRFNELIDAVTADRSDHSEWDKSYLEKKKEDVVHGRKRKRQRTEHAPTTEAKWDDALFTNVAHGMSNIPHLSAGTRKAAMRTDPWDLAADEIQLASPRPPKNSLHPVDYLKEFKELSAAIEKF